MNKSQLYKFFAGESSLTEEIAIREWIEESERNKDEFMHERKLFDTICLNPEKFSSRNNKHIKFSFKKIWQVAAAVAIIISLGLFLNNYSVVEKDTLFIAMNTITVPAGQRVKLTMSDSTVVWLNSLSTFKYPSAFGDNRLVELDGEGFFEVKADTEYPFIVSTSKGTINVTGTVFNVIAFDCDNTFETTLLEGKVKVISEGDFNKSIELRPNQKGKFVNNEFIVEQIEDFDEFLWRNGLISFKNNTLIEIAEKFERQYGVNIILNQQNKRLYKHSYTAKFRTSDGLDYNLDILKRTASFEYVSSNDNKTIFIK